MIYKNYNTIPYPFLHKKLEVISEKYSIEEIFMDDGGCLDIAFKGKLAKDKIRDILLTITPKEFFFKYERPLEWFVDYFYSDHDDLTYVYSAGDINYRTL